MDNFLVLSRNYSVDEFIVDISNCDDFIKNEFNIWRKNTKIKSYFLRKENDNFVFSLKPKNLFAWNSIFYDFCKIINIKIDYRFY